MKSGEITRAVRNWVKGFVRPGMGLLELCQAVESQVLERNGKLPFPCGIGVNHVTAHFSPQPGESATVSASDVVKVDFGVQLNGYLTDTAVTVTFNPDYEPLLEATERALGAAIETVKKDPRTGEVGRAIDREAQRFGFRVIENLTGHTVERYVVHAGRSIPNLFVANSPVLKKGDVFAIEPFLTLKQASGFVVDAPAETIFSILTRKRAGDSGLDEFVSKVWEERKTLPFTPRWYSKHYTREELARMLQELVKKRIVRAYPTLEEASRNPVAQFEHTMAFDEAGLTVLT